ncbi:P-loop containing nucleoside triphosphatehydrolases superfamily protein [Striga asiatica]|uniref:P-loop containing nucleoside triphosphatehydrolases superfamily protein n=1 Tax=Striga asiatica TaxID=4170 RepID=A0A5A7P4E4_STRAF|nr:P-loop containing nucleoside triphosphatehydrolases superfamily protein [Striga asiatica]
MNEARTVVLIGKTGNGKSSTGNSLLGTRAFKSKSSSGSVTATCQLQTTVLENRCQFLYVIDTPGLFDFSGEDHIKKEIVKCVDMAKDGIHAVLFVLSVRSRFSREEENVIVNMIEMFGPKITDYMILLFTGGDDLEESEETLDDYLGRDECPKPLKDIIGKCRKRCILFDNRTTDKRKKNEQLEKLLALIDDVVEYNDGNPYTHELFELQASKNAEKLRIQEEVNSSEQEKMKSYEEQLKRMTEMIELKLKVQTEKLEKQLAKEKAARLKVEKAAKATHKKATEEIRKANENLNKAKIEADRLRNEAGKTTCIIM